MFLFRALIFALAGGSGLAWLMVALWIVVEW